MLEFLVGAPLRNTPTPGADTRTLSPQSNVQHGRVSPLPKWARGSFYLKFFISFCFSSLFSFKLFIYSFLLWISNY